jgi:hypothetical protein
LPDPLAAERMAAQREPIQLEWNRAAIHELVNRLATTSWSDFTSRESALEPIQLEWNRAAIHELVNRLANNEPERLHST